MPPDIIPPRIQYYNVLVQCHNSTQNLFSSSGCSSSDLFRCPYAHTAIRQCFSLLHVRKEITSTRRETDRKRSLFQSDLGLRKQKNERKLGKRSASCLDTFSQRMEITSCISAMFSLKTLDLSEISQIFFRIFMDESSRPI